MRRDFSLKEEVKTTTHHKETIQVVVVDVVDVVDVEVVEVKIDNATSFVFPHARVRLTLVAEDQLLNVSVAHVVSGGHMLQRNMLLLNLLKLFTLILYRSLLQPLLKLKHPLPIPLLRMLLSHQMIPPLPRRMISLFLVSC